jgi:hypothetical protein
MTPIASRSRSWPVRVGEALQLLLLDNCFYCAQQPFAPGFPTNALDPSWVIVLGEAAARGLQWAWTLSAPSDPPRP